MRQVMIAIRTSVYLMILCGLIYPLATTGVAQVLFHKHAEGSLVSINGKVQGSELLAQGFNGPQWFHPRASAAKYDPKASAATNAAVASNEYIKTVKDNVNLLKIAISVAGKWLQNYFHLPIPGSLVGLILLFTLLYFSILPVKWFEVGAEKLVAFIPLFLIPSTTGVINYGSFFLHKGLIVVLTVIISTLLILIVSGSLSQTLYQFKKSKSNRKGINAEL